MQKQLNSSVVIVALLAAVAVFGFVVYSAFTGGRTSSVDAPVMIQPTSPDSMMPKTTASK